MTRAASTNTAGAAMGAETAAGGGADAGDATLGLSAAAAMGSLTPVLASPLPAGQSQPPAGGASAPGSAAAKAGSSGVVGILARSLLVP